MSLTSRAEVRAASSEGREGVGVREGVKERVGGWGEKENAVERRDVCERAMGGIERAERNGTCISHASFQVCSVAGTSHQQLSLSSQCKTFSLPPPAPWGRLTSQHTRTRSHHYVLTPAARASRSASFTTPSLPTEVINGVGRVRGRSGRSIGAVGELEIRREGHQRFIHLAWPPPLPTNNPLPPSCNHFTPTFRNHVEDRQKKVWRSAPVPEISTLH